MTAREVAPDRAQALVASDARTVLLDVREPREWDAGRIPGAIHIPLGALPGRVEAEIPDRSTPVVVYCAHGIRSLQAARYMTAVGFDDVVSLAGGTEAWRGAGLAWEAPEGSLLTDEQVRRYGRHLLMPEVGIEGQARLLASRVLLVGAGGLGSPVALYLAAAGVGTIGIVDFDVVDLSNLQRQVLHTTDRVGRAKVESARTSIAALNPAVRVVSHEEMLTPDNAEGLISGYQVVVDGTDSFETRYALNDAAVRLGIPVVHASVYRFEGQLTVFDPAIGPCYRCLYPSPPPPELAPPCSVAGVLGVVPGIMGMLQANETLKLFLGIGDPLVGRLLLFDALEATFEELVLRRDPACPACGDGSAAGAAGAAGATAAAGAGPGAGDRAERTDPAPAEPFVLPLPDRI